MKQGNQSPLSAFMQVEMNDRTCKVIWIFERGNYIYALKYLLTSFPYIWLT